jgi:hypothetical protein
MLSEPSAVPYGHVPFVVELTQSEAALIQKGAEAEALLQAMASPASSPPAARKSAEPARQPSKSRASTKPRD